jgi:hypothetical protein
MVEGCLGSRASLESKWYWWKGAKTGDVARV